jgi:hypothetical protein
MYTTHTLKYAHRENDIKILAHAIDLLGKKDIAQAIEILMAYRNQLLESQIPTVKQYDPRERV